ncbi:LPS translocon maturation chaperone LptM [Thiofilum flexile]|uniref:LPS translocon maturation chaperone LptM n=1 Tax=Thiofilum flexile TaxID=125627 RepID=UPI000A014F9D|nr:lipoprotein [Thiofilum flexile]
MRTYLVLILIANSLTGCGYKGDLYLPEPKKTEVAPATTPANTTITTETDTPKIKRIIPES